MRQLLSPDERSNGSVNYFSFRLTNSDKRLFKDRSADASSPFICYRYICQEINHEAPTDGGRASAGAGTDSAAARNAAQRLPCTMPAITTVGMSECGTEGPSKRESHVSELNRSSLDPLRENLHIPRVIKLATSKGMADGNMIVNVHIGKYEFAVQCGRGTQSVRWLALAAAKRLTQTAHSAGRLRLRENHAAPLPSSSMSVLPGFTTSEHYDSALPMTSKETMEEPQLYGGSKFPRLQLLLIQGRVHLTVSMRRQNSLSNMWREHLHRKISHGESREGRICESAGPVKGLPTPEHQQNWQCAEPFL